MDLVTSYWGDKLQRWTKNKKIKIRGPVLCCNKDKLYFYKRSTISLSYLVLETGQSRANSCFMLQHTVNCQSLTNLSPLLFLSLPSVSLKLPFFLLCLADPVLTLNYSKTRRSNKMSRTNVSGGMTTRASPQLK